MNKSCKNTGMRSRSNVLDVGSTAKTVIFTSASSRYVINFFKGTESGFSSMWKAVTTVREVTTTGKLDAIGLGWGRNVIGKSHPSRRTNVAGNCSSSGSGVIPLMMSSQVKDSPISRSLVKASHQCCVNVRPSFLELLIPLRAVAATSSTLAPLALPPVQQY